MRDNPVVSVGIPTYDRPDGLRRTLECITQQTYSNLEIIISDNCSPDNETEKVAKEFMAQDGRIMLLHHNLNIGMAQNFNAVLKQASGEYFMWAADDDEWADDFIERCVEALIESGSDYVAAITELQYFSENGRFEFFAQGQPFYEFYSTHVMDRMIHMLNHCYDNLSYSLFRRQALLCGDATIFDALKLKSFNEIPVFLHVVQYGNWLVLPAISFYKKANIGAYEQAKWEIVGGELPNSKGLGYYRYLPRNLEYHRLAMNDIFAAIELLDLSLMEKIKLKSITFALLAKHFGAFVVKRKRRAF